MIPRFLILALCAAILSVASVSAKETQVNEYTRKDGTVIKAHTRETKEKPAEKTEVKSYTRKDGTFVKSYNRKNASKTRNPHH